MELNSKIPIILPYKENDDDKYENIESFRFNRQYNNNNYNYKKHYRISKRNDLLLVSIFIIILIVFLLSCHYKNNINNLFKKFE